MASNDSSSLGDELLEELMSEPTAEDPGFTPMSVFDGEGGYIQTGAFRSSETREMPILHEEILREHGFNPEHVKIVGSPRVSRWQQRAAVREWDAERRQYRRTDQFETVWLEAYKFQIAATGTLVSSDLEAIISRYREDRPKYTQAPYWFVFQAGDQQLGKRSRDGSTQEIITRYLDSIDQAKKQFKSAKHLGIEGIQISMPGDCIEGNQSQGGRNMWLTQETITEQTKVLRRLMMYTIEEFAPLVSRVYLDVVNGNHDQAQREPVSTYPGDGWATACAVAIDERVSDHPSLNHVKVRVPEKWSGFMTVPVGDTMVTVVHGHQWTKATGPMKWWSEQAINNQAPGVAQIIQSGHWHEFKVNSNAHRVAIGSPTYDLGSDWYREKHGATAKRGGLSYLLRSGEVSRLSLV